MATTLMDKLIHDHKLQLEVQVNNAKSEVESRHKSFVFSESCLRRAREELADFNKEIAVHKREVTSDKC